MCRAGIHRITATLGTIDREPATVRIQALTPKDSNADDYALPAADSGLNSPLRDAAKVLH